MEGTRNMTNQKKISERMSLEDYWAVTEDNNPPLNFSSHNKYKSSKRGSQVYKAPVSPHTLWHVVAKPDSDPSAAWDTFAHRKQERRDRERARGQSVPRLLAQTGTPARVSKHPWPNNDSGGGKPQGRGLLWRMPTLCGIGAIAILAMIFALTSPVFGIKRVNIVGTQNSIIIQNIQHMNMLDQNIFLLNVAGPTQRINALPQVATSELSKQWPNQVSIHIVERVPALLWQTTYGTYSVDAQGIVIAPVTDSNAVNNISTVIDLTAQSEPSKQMMQRSNLRPGMHLNRDNIAFAINVLKLLPQMVDISNFKLYYNGTMYTGGIRQWEGEAKRGSYILESPGNWKAYLGGPDDTNPLSNRLIELHEILALAQRQQLNVATIDLRYGVHPVITLHTT
jgi:hypothetical protein